MATLKKEAEDYKPEQTKTIADLDSVPIDIEFHKNETREKQDGSKYKISYIVYEGEEYRVPNSVLEQIQKIIKVKPKTTKIQVVKEGEGLKTSYTTIPLD